MPRFVRIDEASIHEQVHRFYRAVRADALLGPIFDAAIPESRWPAHLRLMCAFWETVMLTTGHYSGKPVAAHRAVAGIAPEQFPRWLALWEETAVALFPPDLAALLALKANRIARNLERAVFPPAAPLSGARNQAARLPA